jgi:hypothetical protein
MRNIFRSPRLVLFVLFLGLFASPVFAQSQAQTPALGMIVKAVDASIGNASASEGASIYSGDELSTSDKGSLLLRVGPLSLELESSSGVHIYRAPYGAVVELNQGSVVYTTPGGSQNIVIVASDVRVTPEITLPDLGRVSMDNPCEITVYSQRGKANVLVGKESRVVEESKAYRVRAENRISYRKYLSPDDSDYHNYHEHEPCAALHMAQGHAPIAAGQSRFLLVSAALIGAGTGVGIWKALESPDKP